MKRSYFFLLFLLLVCLFSGCIQENGKKITELPNQTNISAIHYNDNRFPKISDQINSTALSIAFNNSEVKGSLFDVNYTILDVGPGTLISSSRRGEERRNLTRIDIDTDKALLTIWIDVSNRSVVYINDYPKRSSPPKQTSTF